MLRITRRHFVKLSSVATFATSLPSWGRTPSAVITSRPRKAIVGAIRWDAWYDSTSIPGKAVNEDLAPSYYHFRLPFFANQNSNTEVEINGGQQEVIDQEIDFAAYAGLDYWAFDAYQPSSSMSIALRLYLSSNKRNKINFCMLAGLDIWRNENVLEWHVSLMKKPTYQKILDGRPLYYLGFITDQSVNRNWGGMSKVRTAVDKFRGIVREQANANPYIVILDSEPERSAQYAKALGCDAIGAYQVNFNLHHASFSALVNQTEDLWNRQAASGIPVVPIVTTGLDQRPRFEHPVPWEGGIRPPPNVRDVYYETARPVEIARHLGNCLKWISDHPGSTGDQVCLIYAWNENDEGGWLIPTYPHDTSRIEAIRSVLVAK